MLTDLVIGLLSVLLIAGWLTSSTLRERRKARRAEKELGTTQQNYQLLTEQAADGVFLPGENGKFLLGGLNRVLQFPVVAANRERGRRATTRMSAPNAEITVM